MNNIPDLENLSVLQFPDLTFKSEQGADFHVSTRYVFSAYDATENLKDILEKHVSGKVGIMADAASYAAHREKVEKIVSVCGLKQTLMVIGDSFKSDIFITETMDEHFKDCNFIIAMGSRTVIDASKFYVHQTNKEVIVIPALNALISSGSCFSYLKDEIFFDFYRAKAPFAVICDMEYLTGGTNDELADLFSEVTGMRFSLLELKFNLSMFSEPFSTSVYELAEHIIQNTENMLFGIKNKDINSLQLMFENLIKLSFIESLTDSTKYTRGFYWCFSQVCIVFKNNGLNFSKQCLQASLFLGLSYEKFLKMKTSYEPCDINKRIDELQKFLNIDEAVVFDFLKPQKQYDELTKLQYILDEKRDELLTEVQAVTVLLRKNYKEMLSLLPDAGKSVRLASSKRVLTFSLGIACELYNPVSFIHVMRNLGVLDSFL